MVYVYRTIQVYIVQCARFRIHVHLCVKHDVLFCLENVVYECTHHGKGPDLAGIS